MKCPRCKRPKIDPNGKQASNIIIKFITRYLYDHGEVLEADLFHVTHEMAIHHELCFMENDECPLVVGDDELDMILDLMVKNGHVTRVGDSFAITENGEKYYESLPQEVRDRHKKMLGKK